MIYLTANHHDDFRPVAIYYKSKGLDTLYESNGSVVFPPEGNFLAVGFGFHHYKHKMDINLVYSLIEAGAGIVYVCDELPSNYILHDNIVYIKTGFNWFSHLLFKNPQVFKAVFHNNTRDGIKYATAFSQFSGYRIPIIEDISHISKIKNITTQLKKTKKFLIETFDGIGDILMSLPSAYTLHKQGWKVSYFVHPNRASIFNNLEFIDKVYTNREEIPIYLFSKHIILTHRLSTYSLSFNQQHRIYSSAYLCGLSKEELLIHKPIIKLSEDEKKWALDFVKNYKNPVGICWSSYGTNRSYFRDYTQQLINLLTKKKFGCSTYTPIILSGENNQFPFKGAIDMSGKTTLRQLFALVWALDYIITVDTGILHIAGAFDKPTIALMGPIPAEWRCSTYKNCIPLEPKVTCYKHCWDCQAIEPSKRMCRVYESYCLRTIKPNEIYSTLRKLKKYV